MKKSKDQISELEQLGRDMASRTPDDILADMDSGMEPQGDDTAQTSPQTAPLDRIQPQGFMREPIFDTGGKARREPYTASAQIEAALKPPIGIEPEFLWIERRIDEIDECIKRWHRWGGSKTTKGWRRERRRLFRELKRAQRAFHRWLKRGDKLCS